MAVPAAGHRDTVFGKRSMSGARWERVKEICLEALDRPEAERAAFVERACVGDAALRAEVDGLLRAYDPVFLEEPLVRFETAASEVDSESEATARLGPYRLVRPVGQGGMGEVYLAVQEGDGFERPVAVKLVRAGMATDDVLERFRLERSILASLDHPNLAKLIDGGRTEDGLPFFVMEYVDGVPITEYCDRRALSVRDRLMLFLSVCDAVHHAHRSLVVHRDIKPSNILVTRDGVPKLLDFGIGKVLDDSAPGLTRGTVAGARALTPEYAAPEQVLGGPITTATDVHGLGILLFELLTGHHPFAREASTPEQLGRALVETQPPSPSTVVTGGDARASASVVTEPSEVARRRSTVPTRLRRALRGDLDNIVLQALRKEPGRRYTSVEALRADIERHLEGRPVLARADSLGYRLSRFVGRNPWASAAAVVAVLASAVAIVLPWRQNVRLTVERDRAREVQNFLLEAFGTTGGDEQLSAGELLDLQAARVDSTYRDRPEVRGQMHLALSEAYERLGRYDDAVSEAEGALDAFESVHDGDHPDVGSALNALGWALRQAGDREVGAEYLVRAVGMRRRLGRGARLDLARSLNDLGVVRADLGDRLTSAELLRESLAIRVAELGDASLATAITANNLATTLYLLGEPETARVEGERALTMLRASVGPDHQRTVIAQNNLLVYMLAVGDYEAAVPQYEDLLARQSRLQGAEHPITNRVRMGLAGALGFLRRHDEAYGVWGEVIEHARARGDGGVDDVLRAQAGRIGMLLGMEREAEAVELAAEALAEARRVRPEGAGLRSILFQAASALAAAEAWDAAVETMGEYVARIEALEGSDPVDLAQQRVRYADYLERVDRTREADSLLALARPVVDSERATEELRAYHAYVRRVLETGQRAAGR